MKRASKGKRWLFRAAIVLAVLVLCFVIELATSRFALYGWKVPLRVRVVDASTGAPIEEATVSYGFSFGEQSHYEQAGPVAVGPIIRMTYCQGEGGVSTLFKGPPHPVPSMYRFEFAAAGFLVQRIDGTAGELVEDPGKPGGEQFALRLPDVKLERLTR